MNLVLQTAFPADNGAYVMRNLIVIEIRCSKYEFRKEIIHIVELHYKYNMLHIHKYAFKK